MRTKIISAILTLLFILIVGFLFYTQLIRGPSYKNLAEKNRIRLVPLNAPRGRIFDRNGQVIVDNSLTFNICILPQELKAKDRVFEELGKMLGISKGEVEATYRKGYTVPFAPVVVKEDVSKKIAFLTEEKSSDFSGVIVDAMPRRDYLYKDATAPIIGYLGEVDRYELNRLREYGYKIRDVIGKSGIEKFYDRYIRGRDGGRQIEVDNKGRRLRVLGIKEPVAGTDLSLTIDIRLQNFIYDIMKDKKGAVIAMDPKTGEILALVSVPAYDSNIFVRSEMAGEKLKIIKDSDDQHRLLNRAINCSYPPGSIFKLIVASAALESNKIDQHTTFSCSGSYKLGGTAFDCWKKDGHGYQDIRGGIKNSCNVFFYNVGHVTGSDIISNFAYKFGLGKPTGIDLPGEVGGLVPNRTWKRFTKNETWFEGDTLNYAIGQGYLLVTPLQMLVASSAISNNGQLVQPYIVKSIGPNAATNHHPRQIDVKKDVIDIVKGGMIMVVNDPEGTGRKAKVDGVKIAGKTGTAQTGQGLTHAWFIGFSSWEEPKLSIVVFIEYGGMGGYAAAEIAGPIFKKASELGLL